MLEQPRPHLSNCSHPQMFKFIDVIKNDMQNFHSKIVQNNTGMEPTPRHKKYTDIDLRIEAIVDGLEADSQTNLLDYLRDLAMILY